MNMTKSQKAVVFITIVVIFVMGLFPPVSRSITGKINSTRHVGYEFILDINSSPSDDKNFNINISLLLTQWLGVILIASGAFALVTFPRKPLSKEEQDYLGMNLR